MAVIPFGPLAPTEIHRRSPYEVDYAFWAAMDVSSKIPIAAYPMLRITPHAVTIREGAVMAEAARRMRAYPYHLLSLTEAIPLAEAEAERQRFNWLLAMQEARERIQASQRVFEGDCDLYGLVPAMAE